MKFVPRWFSYFHFSLSQPQRGNPVGAPAPLIDQSHFSVSVPVQLLLKSNLHNQLVDNTERRPFRDPFHTIELRFSEL
jgi:hypothetical protein